MGEPELVRVLSCQAHRADGSSADASSRGRPGPYPADRGPSRWVTVRVLSCQAHPPVAELREAATHESIGTLAAWESNTTGGALQQGEQHPQSTRVRRYEFRRSPHNRGFPTLQPSVLGTARASLDLLPDFAP